MKSNEQIAKDYCDKISTDTFGSGYYNYSILSIKSAVVYGLEYAQQFASQPPAQGEGRMWEEIPVTELKPEDTIENDEPKYFLLLKDREFIGLGFFAPITKIWVVDGRKRTPTHYLRPVTGQRYSEAIEIVKELAEWSEKYPRQTVYPVSADIDGKLIAIEEKAKQFIQSLNKK